jgi:hypothetical protein
MLYRGKERLLHNGVLCMPVDEYLKALKPQEFNRSKFVCSN